jgi:hypothetical protein
MNCGNEHLGFLDREWIDSRSIFLRDAEALQGVGPRRHALVERA